MAEINEVEMIGGTLGKDARFEQPTVSLRWVRGKLQQAWLVTQCGEVNQPISHQVEWRDVPDETSALAAVSRPPA